MYVCLALPRSRNSHYVNELTPKQQKSIGFNSCVSFQRLLLQVTDTDSSADPRIRPLHLRQTGCIRKRPTRGYHR